MSVKKRVKGLVVVHAMVVSTLGSLGVFADSGTYELICRYHFQEGMVGKDNGTGTSSVWHSN